MNINDVFEVSMIVFIIFFIHFVHLNERFQYNINWSLGKVNFEDFGLQVKDLAKYELRFVPLR